MNDLVGGRRITGVQVEKRQPLAVKTDIIQQRLNPPHALFGPQVPFDVPAGPLRADEDDHGIGTGLDEDLMAGLDEGMGSRRRHADAELERALSAGGKDEQLASIRNIIPAGVTCVYIRQGEPLGLGHAVLCARSVVGHRPFSVHLADDLIDAPTPCLEQMRQLYEETGGSVVGVQRVPRDQTDQYGVVDGEPVGVNLR